MILATDLDGTFLGGTDEQKKLLYKKFFDNNTLRLVFVSGRGLESILPLLEEPAMPRPDYIICDVGATIVAGISMEPVEPIQSLIEDRWPGKARVSTALSGITGLLPQQVPQQHRCSYFYNSDTDLELLKARTQLLGCDLILSAGKFADVLPAGINKGFTLQLLARQLEFQSGKILVAGDTFNDLSLFHSGYSGVVVGNAEPGLTDATAGLTTIYHAREAGAGGILEAMEHFALPG